jgi:mannose-6-phosphate isomerase-like protein (cupin superfamily)
MSIGLDLLGLDLETTYLSLDGKGVVASHPVGADFWDKIDANADLLATMVAVFRSDADWGHWEMHPAGDEIVMLIEGEVTMIVQQGSTERRVALTPGHAIVIPAGARHRALVACSPSLMARAPRTMPCEAGAMDSRPRGGTLENRAKKACASAARAAGANR